MEKNNRKNIWILFLTLVITMVGFGLVMPILPFYIESMGAGGSELGLVVALYAFMRLVFAPIWGGLSDRIGRKPVLLVGIFGYGITMILFGLATKLWMLFVFRSLSGILSSATTPTAMAYVSDNTSEENRSSGMGAMGAAIGIGTIIGPGIGGLLTDQSLSIPFFFAGGMSFLSLVLVLLFLPESLEAKDRLNSKNNTQINAKELWLALNGPIGILLLMATLFSYSFAGFYSVFGLYAYAKFNYGPKEVGMILMVVGLISSMCQGLLSGPTSNYFGEENVIKGALLATAVGYIAMSYANGLLTILITIGFFAFATALLSPAVTALISKRATLDQGIAMGLSNSFMSLGYIIGPAIAGITFDMNIEYPNLSSALVMVIGFIASLLLIKRVPDHMQFSTSSFLRRRS